MDTSESVPAPSIGRVVHYVSYGTPGGEFTSQCRATIVTEVAGGDSLNIGGCVLNPTGHFDHPLAINGGLPYHDGSGDLGDPNCPNSAGHAVFKYCQSCSFRAPEMRGGTWHWPERV